MPAPDLETIYDPESAIELAAKNVLATYSIAAFTQRETEKLPVPRVDIELQITGARTHRGQRAAGILTQDAWDGTLTFWVVTDRPRSGVVVTLAKRHHIMRSRVRMACTYFLEKFTAGVLPYHVLSHITEAGSDPQVNIDDDIDISVLRYTVVVSVRTGQWPV